MTKQALVFKEMVTLFLSTLQQFVKVSETFFLNHPFKDHWYTIWLDHICKHVVGDDNPQEIGHKVGLTHVVSQKN